VCVCVGGWVLECVCALICVGECALVCVCARACVGVGVDTDGCV
jgi:hypothetical protein